MQPAEDELQISPRIRDQSITKKLSGTRKRRHSSLQMENKKTIPDGADIATTKIQIFKVFGVHLPILLQKERALMGYDDNSPSKEKKKQPSIHLIPRIVTITVEYLKSSNGKNKLMKSLIDKKSVNFAQK